MKKSFAGLLGLSLFLAIASRAEATCGAITGVVHGLGSYFQCADSGPVAGFSYQLTNPLGVNSDGQDILDEGALGDGQVQSAFDWSSGGFVGCPVTLAGPQRIAIVVEGNDGKGLIVSLSGADPNVGYLVEPAHKYDPVTGLAKPLPCGDTAGAPAILSQSSSGGLATLAIQINPPIIYSDCDSDSLGIVAGLATCPDHFAPSIAVGRIFTRLGDCVTAPDLRLNQWTDTGLLPDGNGNATVTTQAPGKGQCLDVGSTTFINGFESSGITGFVTVPGEPCFDLDHDGVTDCQGDCDDANPARFPGNPEICDGIDNNCDGLADNGLACQGSCFPPSRSGTDVRVTSDPNYSAAPSIAWSGETYGIAWFDGRDGNYEIYFARLDSAGSKIGPDQRITDNPGVSSAPSIVWTGAEYGLAWSDNRDGNFEVYFKRLDAAGNALTGDIRLTNAPGDSLNVSLVSTGTGYGLAWEDMRDGGNDEIYFARLDTAGSKIGADVRITNQPNLSNSPSIVWNGSGYGLAFLDNRNGGYGDVYFVSVSAAGSKIGLETRVTSSSTVSTGPRLVWNGAGYGVAWGDNRNGLNANIFFARLDPSGARLGGDVQVDVDSTTWSILPSLVWNGVEFGVSWQDFRDGNWEIYFIGLTAQGVRIGGDFRLTNAPEESGDPQLIWTGTEYVFA